MELLPLCADAGLCAVEITMNTSGAAKMIERATHQFGNALSIGAGTVCNLTDLRTAKDAGAGFIVMPIVEPDVVRACADDGMPVFPGAMTPSEVALAWTLGATMVKLFPAGLLGPSYARDILAPLSHIPLLVTGGVGLEQLAHYWSVGVKGFGIGTPLFPKEFIRTRSWVSMKTHMTTYVATMRSLISGEMGGSQP